MPDADSLETTWLGRTPYRVAWQRQHDLVRRRRSGQIGDQLLLVEHEPVLTLGRNSDPAHIRASADELKWRAIETIRIERGGEVTYHGPGQLVAYPIVRLADRGILLRPFVRLLEQAMIDTAASFGVDAGRRAGYPGVWCDPESDAPRKLGALGLRLEGGVTYHGIALNVTTDLSGFELIDPCGMVDAQATAIAREADWPHPDTPTTASVAQAADRFAVSFAERLAEATTTARVAVPA